MGVPAWSDGNECCPQWRPGCSWHRHGTCLQLVLAWGRSRSKLSLLFKKSKPKLFLQKQIPCTVPCFAFSSNLQTRLTGLGSQGSPVWKVILVVWNLAGPWATQCHTLRARETLWLDGSSLKNISQSRQSLRLWQVWMPSLKSIVEAFLYGTGASSTLGQWTLVFHSSQGKWLLNLLFLSAGQSWSDQQQHRELFNKREQKAAV